MRARPCCCRLRTGEYRSCDDLLRGPKPLADELYPKLVEHYEDEDNVTVIVDRRESDRRARRPPAAIAQRRVVRDVAARSALSSATAAGRACPGRSCRRWLDARPPERARATPVALRCGPSCSGHKPARDADAR